MQRRAILILGGGMIATSAIVASAVLLSRSRAGAERAPLEIPASNAARRIETGERSPARVVYSPTLRVNLTPNAVKSIRLALDAPWIARPVGSDRVVARGPVLSEVEAVPTATGFRIGSIAVSVARLEIAPEKSPGVWVNGHQYRGTLRLFRRPGNEMIAVNALPLEEYVPSVVDGEMPATFPDEARKSQAILARTYALFRIAEARAHPEFDLYATTRSQNYPGVQYRTADGRRLAGESAESRRLTEETAGVVCTAEGRVFSTYYCAVCGGGTIDGRRVFSDAAPVIQGVACDWCQAAERYRWSARISREQASDALASHFQAKGESIGSLTKLSPADDAAPGPSKLFSASDGRRSRTVSAVELRRLMPAAKIHSPFFTIRQEGDEWVLSGRGHGHGVGVCQWGARGLALEQKDCYEILRHYYPGVRFVRVQPPADH